MNIDIAGEIDQPAWWRLILGGHAEADVMNSSRSSR